MHMHLILLMIHFYFCFAFEENASFGKMTYVHCKAGRGRSTTVVLCYLVCAHSLLNLLTDLVKHSFNLSEIFCFHNRWNTSI